MKENRRFLRIATNMEAEYWAKGPSMMRGQAHVRDFSREGLGVWLPRPVGKGEHVDLLTGILIGAVIGGIYATHLATYVPLLLVILGVVFGLKFLGLR